ncbi:MAG: zinc ribbon domain-containing protein, partial [Gammaproteobacteria bacterium]|nr:zinc ribbon domain-containing protein [Gammaproteobacteria bacterium]
MPIYEYACHECNHTLDALQKIADAPLVDCPACGKPGLKRLLSAPRFRLKGSGWYETDFKKDNQRNLHGELEPSKSKDK